MCGIAGCVVESGERPDAGALERMAAALGHRGPDDRGIEIVGNVGLVHTRLSIVDPSPAGHQPMRDEAGDWWLTYNGEVFNHSELRAELTGADWRSGTDTETLLRALAAWGEDAIPRCNGLFAFAALDARRGRLLLVRDRFGVKPLYLARHGGGLWFASELRALLAAGVPARARPDVLAHSVAYGWANGRQTPLAGIDRLLPGTLVEVGLDSHAVEERRWYDPAAAVDRERAAALAGRPRDLLAGEVESALRASVRRRLMADVPLGAMCSGGLDSSLIAAFARDEQPGLLAFNAAVADQPAVDESAWAARVARHLGIELRTTVMSADSWRAGFVEAVRHNEFPLMHESSVPMAQIAALARAAGVKVLLSGEGADELFAGYDGLHVAEYRAFLPPALARRQHVTALLRRADALRRRRGRDLVGGVRRRLERPPGSRILTPPTAASSDAYETDVAARGAAAYAHHRGPPGPHEAALHGDLQTYLPHLLNRQDKNTMQHSIETRVPFLDPEVVALSLNLPLEARATPERKGVLRDLARAHLPRGVARRTKLGFGFDVRRYLDGAARPEFLADGRLRDALAVPAEEWRAAVAHLSSAHALRLWSGEAWCRLFLDGEDPAAVEAALWR
jgi:asparagine synthase (glutamine-hydrolysing)